jgi:dihydrofolate reductase
MISLDGYFEGPSGQIDWHTVDEEFNDYAVDLLNNSDILLFGRKTYEVMVAWWPTTEALKNDPLVARKMNSLQKFVFSRTMKKADWQHTQLISENAAAEILKLKQERGEYMVIFGSPNLALTCIEHRLIDEYRVIVSPVFLGSGHTLFEGISDRTGMELKSTRTFTSGNVLLTYALK